MATVYTAWQLQVQVACRAPGSYSCSCSGRSARAPLPRESIDIHLKKDIRRGVVNNQQTDWSFKLDGVLHDASQDLVYETVAKDAVSQALDGYNGTIMCYGQTGAGKTYTMTGATENYKHRGILPRALQQVFRMIEEHPTQAITVRVS
uniref:Kinesin family member 9 n=1 Tax=Nannospalax galili TaxID=1026970 RepID=A0A8C6RJK7_NANGA